MEVDRLYAAKKEKKEKKRYIHNKGRAHFVTIIHCIKNKKKRVGVKGIFRRISTTYREDCRAKKKQKKKRARVLVILYILFLKFFFFFF